MRVGIQPACEPERADDESAADKLLARPIEDLQLSTRAYNSLKNAGIQTIGQLAELSEPDLLGLRNLGAKSLDEINERLRRLAVDARALLTAVDQIRPKPRTLTPMQAKRERRSAISEAVLDVVKAQVGRTVGVQQIHDEVSDRLEFVPEEGEVRECLRLHAKDTECFVKVTRDAYAWAPDGQVPPPPAPPHVVDMIERRWRGDTLDQIGAAHGLTRERIRQLLKKHGGPSGDEIRELRAAEARSAQRAHEEAVTGAIREALDGRGPTTVGEMAEATGLDGGDIARHWPQDLAHLRLWGAGKGESRWSDEDICEALRQASAYEFPLTTSAYSELLQVGQINGPSVPRIGQRFGSWTAACAAAGVVAGDPWNREYESRWSDEDLLQIARAYILDPNAPSSAHRFDEWKREYAPDGPSAQTLRNRFGSWTEVKRRALAQGGAPGE